MYVIINNNGYTRCDVGVNDGHRQRMRERIVANGTEGLHAHEILEYILYAFIPRKDTNGIAHALINEFGSLSKVIDADIQRLAAVKGMSMNAAIFIHSLGGIYRRYEDDKKVKGVLLNNVEACVRFARPLMESLPHEEVHILLKDSSSRLIKRERLSVGIVDETAVYMREVLDSVLKNSAVSAVLIHNHPSGICVPSGADDEMTNQIALSMSLVGINLDDHIIIGGENYYSYKLMGKLDKLANSQISLQDGKIKDIKI